MPDIKDKSTRELIRENFLKVRNKKDDAKEVEIVELLTSVALKSGAVTGMMNTNLQQDATEFLLPLLENLYDVPPLLETSTFKAYTSEVHTPKLPKAEAAVITTLYVKNDIKSISGMLKSYQEKEQVKAMEFEDPFSPSKPIKTNADKKIELSVNEGVKEIVFTIKRTLFDQASGVEKRSDNYIECDKIILPVGDKGTSESFYPTAYICHIGANNPNEGHYITYVKEEGANNKKGWFKYDDKNRSPIEEKDLPKEIGTNVYAIKYSTADCPLPSPQTGARNFGNTCWLNASIVFVGACEWLLQKQKTNKYHKNSTLTSAEFADDDSTNNVPELNLPVRKVNTSSNNISVKRSETNNAAGSFVSFNQSEKTNESQLRKETNLNDRSIYFYDIHNDSSSDIAAEENPLTRVPGYIKSGYSNLDTTEQNSVNLDLSPRSESSVSSNPVFTTNPTKNDAPPIHSVSPIGNGTKEEIPLIPSVLPIEKETQEIKVSIPSPSPSSENGKFYVTTLMEVETTMSPWKNTERKNNYKTLDGAYPTDRTERIEESQEIMRNILVEISHHPSILKRNENKPLNINQLVEIILLAKEKGGVAHTSNGNSYSPVEPTKENKLARAVSALYQKRCQECGIYSGRGTSNKGSRLTFLPETILEEFKKIVKDGRGKGMDKMEIGESAVKDAEKAMDKKAKKVSKVLKNGNYQTSDNSLQGNSSRSSKSTDRLL